MSSNARHRLKFAKIILSKSYCVRKCKEIGIENLIKEAL